MELASKRLELLKMQGERRLNSTSVRVTVGMGTCGRAAGSEPVFRALSAFACEREDLGIEVVAVGCRGACWAEPLVEVQIQGRPRVAYGNVDVSFAEKIAGALAVGELPCEHVVGDQGIESADSGSSEGDARLSGDSILRHPYFSFQERRVMARCGLVDPCSVEEYAATGGLAGLSKLLMHSISPEQVLNELIESGLRGRGGAGFSTGVKWQAVYDQPGDIKYVIANGDEGDPGAFMDRCLMESDPMAIIEGMIIAGITVGAKKGYLFTRAEYDLAANAMRTAIAAAKKSGILGDRILGTEYSFEIEVIQSAGAYVCGEETALIKALEGLPCRPRPRPPYASEEGLWGKPTCVNNVETLASVPLVVSKGCGWYREVGTASSPGTKVFSMAGAIEGSGLIEVPLGIGLNEVLEATESISPLSGCTSKPDEGSRCGIKAVQLGGPSGIIAPISAIKGLDYEDLDDIGGTIGSGGLIFLGYDDCIVEAVRHLTQFSIEEDCGQCRFARSSMDECMDILDRLTEGLGPAEDLDRIECLCDDIARTSLCALGRLMVGPIRSSLKYFGDEYRSHVEGRCPAKQCRSLIEFDVVKNLCPGCRCCAPVCPTNAMRGKFGKPYEIVERLCIRCRMCISSCPYHAVEVRDRG